MGAGFGWPSGLQHLVQKLLPGRKNVQGQGPEKWPPQQLPPPLRIPSRTVYTRYKLNDKNHSYLLFGLCNIFKNWQHGGRIST